MAWDHRRASDDGPELDDGEPPDPERVRAALGRLADGRSPSPSVVRRAEAAVEDLERAAAFVDSGGLAELEAAVERSDDEGVVARGERALDTFRRFRDAAAGELAQVACEMGSVDSEWRNDDCERQPVDSAGPSSDGDGRRPAGNSDGGGHFHRGRGTDLRRDGEATSP